jgi:hypothetical protein
MSLRSPNLVANPLTVSLYVDDYNYFAVPTPPASDELITENGDLILTENGNELITE